MYRRNWFQVILAQGLAIVLCLIGLISSAHAESAGVLRAGISTNIYQKQSALDPILWVGNQFDKQTATNLLKVRAENFHVWRVTPNWLAGRWQYTQTTTSRAANYVGGQPEFDNKNLSTYSSKAVYILGEQRDRNGAIWDQYGSD